MVLRAGRLLVLVLLVGGGPRRETEAVRGVRRQQQGRGGAREPCCTRGGRVGCRQAGGRQRSPGLVSQSVNQGYIQVGGRAYLAIGRGTRGRR